MCCRPKRNTGRPGVGSRGARRAVSYGWHRPFGVRFGKRRRAFHGYARYGRSRYYERRNGRNENQFHGAARRIVGPGSLGKRAARHCRRRGHRAGSRSGSRKRPVALSSGARARLLYSAQSRWRNRPAHCTQASYEEYLKLTRDRFAQGIVSDLDVAQAETQLYGVQAQLLDLGVQRAQLEHAIAVLIGKAPADVTVPPMIVATVPPIVPEGVPSELLECRPDISAANAGWQPPTSKSV